VLEARYRTRAGYLAVWSAGVDAMAASGTLRPEDAADMKARGAAVALPFE
jgi:hypothetical protein